MRLVSFAVVSTAVAVVTISAAGAIRQDDPPPPPPPFVADFEVGDPGWQQFTGLQHERERPTADSFALVRTPVRQGKNAARITVRHGYSQFGHSEDTSLFHQSREGDGAEYWYAFSTLFPRDWVKPYRWGIFAEWHANLDTSPIIAFNAAGDTAELNVHTGVTNEEANSFQHNLNLPLLGTLSKGRWNDFVMRVRWRTAPSGTIEVWHRLAGQVHMRKLVSLSGIPTLQWTTGGRGYFVYLLFGLYRGSHCPKPTELDCASSLGVQATNTLYHDSYVRAESFDEVARHAYPGARPILCSTRKLISTRKPRPSTRCAP